MLALTPAPFNLPAPCRKEQGGGLPVVSQYTHSKCTPAKAITRNKKAQDHDAFTIFEWFVR